MKTILGVSSVFYLNINMRNALILDFNYDRAAFTKDSAFFFQRESEEGGNFVMENSSKTYP